MGEISRLDLFPASRTITRDADSYSLGADSQGQQRLHHERKEKETLVLCRSVSASSIGQQCVAYAMGIWWCAYEMKTKRNGLSPVEFSVLVGRMSHLTARLKIAICARKAREIERQASGWKDSFVSLCPAPGLLKFAPHDRTLRTASRRRDEIGETGPFGAALQRHSLGQNRTASLFCKLASKQFQRERWR